MKVRTKVLTFCFCMYLYLFGGFCPQAWSREMQEEEDLQRSDHESIASVGKLILGERRVPESKSCLR